MIGRLFKLVFKRGRRLTGLKELEFKLSGGGRWVYFQVREGENRGEGARVCTCPCC